MIGTSLLHYEITAKLGEGGMGEVYRARDGRLGRDVAIKVLPEIFVSDPERLARFEREAQLLAALNHPNIGAIYGLEEADDKRFLVLELIDGSTLQELIKKGVPLDRALEMSAQVARALEAAHEQGIVHRDLKPANVKVTPDGTVKVLDFGLAKAWGPDANDPHISASPTLTAQMTQAGMILGTAAYMSPEQARGQEVDKRADIWSFGVLTYEMLTGRGLFGGDTVTDTLAAVVRADPDWQALPRATPRRTREMLSRCLEKDPDVRLRDIGEARIALEGAEPEEGVEAVGEVGPVAAPRFAWLPWAVAAAAVLVALLAVTGVFPPRPDPPRDIVGLRAEIAPGASLVATPGPHFAFSPDGRAVAYVAGSEGAEALFLRDLESLEARELSGTTGAGQPFFSPDGEWIAYFSSGRLRKVSVRGGAPLTLAEEIRNARGGSWGEDGFIYYAPDTITGIWRVAADGGEPEEVTTPASEEPAERSHRWPQALADGKSVLLTVQLAVGSFDEADLEILDVATGERQLVVRGGSMGRYLPTGDATAGHLIFVREGTIYAAPFDLRSREIGRQPTPMLEGVQYAPNNGGAHLAVSSQGSLLYFTGSNSQRDAPVDLVRVEADGSREPLSATRMPYRNPTYSPDGRSIAVGMPAEGGGDVWSLDLGRDVATRLTFAEGGDFAQICSPDGAFIVFTSTRGGGFNLWRKSTDGTSEAEQLTETGSFVIAQDWHPGADLLLFRDFAGDDLMILDLETLRAEPFIQSEFVESNAEFSPDGRWVVYRSDESGRGEIYVRPFPASAGKWQVSSSGGDEPHWSPDGTTIYYWGADDRIYAVEAEADGSSFRAGAPRAVLDAAFRKFLGRNWDVAPDGSFVFLAGEEGPAPEAELPVMIFNWFEHLRRLVPLERP